MGFLYSLLLSTVFFFGVSTVPYDDVSSAIKRGDSTKLVGYCKDKVLIQVDGKEGAYAKSQAGMVLKNFFTKNPCSDFSFHFKGAPTSEGAFAIGKYKTGSKTYRFTVHFINSGGKDLIERISIEED